MNFAPYQSSPPESTRALSPPLRSPTASPKPGANNLRPGNANRHISSVADNNDPWAAARGAPLPSPSQFADRGYDDLESGQNERSYFVNSGGNNGGAGVGLGVNAEGGGGGRGTDVFETSLGIRMEIEACLPYLLLPPAGGVALLLFEHKSDYVRFHAWQSALVFSAIFVVHLIFSWTAVLSWLLFVGDLVLIAWLVFHAYRDAETLDRLELPFFGRLASRFVDSE